MRYEKISTGFFLRLEKGEDVLPTLGEFMTSKKVGGGFICGIGAVEQVTLGYFDLQKQKYLEKKFPGVYELVSFSGNIAYVDGQPFVHAHVVISDRKMTPFAGHFFGGKIAITGEFYVAIAGKKFARALEPEIGLNLLNFTKTT